MSNPTQKLVANLQARAALAGGAAVVTQGDGGRPLFVLNCGALTKQAGTVDDLDAAVCAVELQPLLGLGGAASKPDRPENKAPGREANGYVSRTKLAVQGLGGLDGSQGHRAAQPMVGFGRSTSAEAQRQRIIQASRIGPQTSYDLRRLGCYHAPARIKELRDRFGYCVLNKRVTLWDSDGYPHLRAALYVLEAEPAVIGGGQ